MKEYTATDGITKYYDARWRAYVDTSCLNATEQDRIYAIMREKGRNLNGAIELARENKDARLSAISNTSYCVTINGVNR